MNPKRKHPQKINKLVSGLLSKWEKQTKNRDAIFNALWKKIAGTRISEHTRVELQNNRKLCVFVESSAWMNELTFLKEKIKIEAKSAFLDYGISVDDVFFKLG